MYSLTYDGSLHVFVLREPNGEQTSYRADGLTTAVVYAYRRRTGTFFLATDAGLASGTVALVAQTDPRLVNPVTRVRAFAALDDGGAPQVGSLALTGAFATTGGITAHGHVVAELTDVFTSGPTYQPGGLSPIDGVQTPALVQTGELHAYGSLDLRAMPAGGEAALGVGSVGAHLDPGDSLYEVTALDGLGGETLPQTLGTITVPDPPVPVVLTIYQSVATPADGGFQIYRNGDLLANVFMDPSQALAAGSVLTYTDTGGHAPNGAIHPPSVSTSGSLRVAGSILAHTSNVVPETDGAATAGAPDAATSHLRITVDGGATWYRIALSPDS